MVSHIVAKIYRVGWDKNSDLNRDRFYQIPPKAYKSEKVIGGLGESDGA